MTGYHIEHEFKIFIQIHIVVKGWGSDEKDVKEESPVCKWNLITMENEQSYGNYCNVVNDFHSDCVFEWLAWFGMRWLVTFNYYVTTYFGINFTVAACHVKGCILTSAEILL
jgi:hypothetical protein